MPIGRPTKHSKELEQKAWDYANGGWETVGHAVPSVAGLVGVLKVNRSTVYDWAKDESKDFSNILETINAKQEEVCINRSITGDYNATIAKLLLGKHGYHDKQDTKHSGDRENPVAVQEIVFNPVGNDTD